MSDYKLIVFGSSNDSFGDNFGFDIKFLGRLYDEVSLRLVYSATDVFIVPSIEENLPNTGLEALACGTPVVGFNVGGMPDLINDKVNGRLVQDIDVKGLGECIHWVLEDSDRHRVLCKAARAVAEEHFDLRRQVKDYLNVYEGMVGGKS